MVFHHMLLNRNCELCICFLEQPKCSKFTCFTNPLKICIVFVHTEKIVCISKTRTNKNQYSINLGHPAEKERSVRDGDCSVHYQTCTAVDMPFVALDASDPSCCHLTGSSYVIQREEFQCCCEFPSQIVIIPDGDHKGRAPVLGVC